MRILSYVLALCATSALAGAMTLIWYVFGTYWRSLAPAAFLDWITFAYEVPINHAFEARTLPLDQVAGALDSWMRWHVGRILFGVAAAILGTVALARRASDLDPAHLQSVGR